MKKVGFFLVVFFLVVNLGGVSAPLGAPTNSKSAGDYNISGNSYINSTYNLRLSLPENGKWKYDVTSRDLGDALQILLFTDADYGAAGIIAVTSGQKSLTLDDFAKKSALKFKSAKFTYMAGKPAVFMTKKEVIQGTEFTQQVYAVVKDGVGYMLTFAFASQWDLDERLQQQIDAIMNTFAFLNEKGILQETAPVDKDKKNILLNVAMLELTDIRDKKTTKITSILTNELQDQLFKTGQFKFVERRKLNQIVEENKLGRSGIVSDAMAAKIGGLAGAKYIISGSVGALDDTSVIYAQVTDVENGKIIASASTRCRKCENDSLLDSVGTLASRLLKGK